MEKSVAALRQAQLSQFARELHEALEWRRRRGARRRVRR